uniref:(northern house mosquito) hypothetical protein n=1 Tax=Culex pipiens TaxID=7175 RepID=A0A8D8IPE6_CULPI
MFARSLSTPMMSSAAVELSVTVTVTLLESFNGVGGPKRDLTPNDSLIAPSFSLLLPGIKQLKPRSADSEMPFLRRIGIGATIGMIGDIRLYTIVCSSSLSSSLMTRRPGKSSGDSHRMPHSGLDVLMIVSGESRSRSLTKSYR